jgi:hypothetical protein
VSPVAYYVSRPSGGGSLVRTLAEAQRRERGYDRRARRLYGRGAGYDATIVAVYPDYVAAGGTSGEAEREPGTGIGGLGVGGVLACHEAAEYVRQMSARARRRWGITAGVRP